MYRTPDGTIARGRVALDTQSNMSFSIACVSLAREKRPWETDVVYGVGGKPVSVGETLSFTVMRNGQAVTLDRPGTFDTKPPDHKHAKAWMNAMELIQPFAAGSPFPVQVFTDHSPLTWIKHTNGKGPVSQFLVDKLSTMDFVMNYIKGPDNIVADAV